MFKNPGSGSVDDSPVQERCSKRKVPLSYPPPLLLYTITLPSAILLCTPYPLLKWRQEYSYRLLNRADKSTLDAYKDRVGGACRLAVGSVIVYKSRGGE
jgi:hypothetical protein